MNKFVGLLNIVLLTVILIALGVGNVSFEQRELLLGMVITLVPLTLTMFAMEPEEERLGLEVVEMARNPAAHAESHQQLCEASLRFYETVRSLPQSERVLAARGLFQVPAE